jgi:hypothetical protein
MRRLFVIQRRKPRSVVGEESGLAVIEATISFTAFALVIAIIYSVINFCVVEARVRFAVNAATKEISSYGYLMRLAGLDQLEAERAQNGHAAVETIQGAAENYNQVKEGYNELRGVLDGGSLTSVDLETLEDGVDGGVALYETARQVAKDPMQFVQSLVDALMGELRDEAAKYFVKALVEKHLEGGDSRSVHDYLTEMGVVNGLDGVDIATPNFLGSVPGGTAADSWNVNVEACYYVEIENFLRLDTKVRVCTAASTRAWMGDLAGGG